MSDDTQAPESTHALPERLKAGDVYEDGMLGYWRALVYGNNDHNSVFHARGPTMESAVARAAELVRRWNAEADMRELVEAVRRLEPRVTNSGLTWCAVCDATFRGDGTRHQPDCWLGILLEKHKHVNVSGALRDLINESKESDR